jgi:hypothetical protein
VDIKEEKKNVCMGSMHFVKKEEAFTHARCSSVWRRYLGTV